MKRRTWLDHTQLYRALSRQRSAQRLAEVQSILRQSGAPDIDTYIAIKVQEFGNRGRAGMNRPRPNHFHKTGKE